MGQLLETWSEQYLQPEVVDLDLNRSASGHIASALNFDRGVGGQIDRASSRVWTNNGAAIPVFTKVGRALNFVSASGQFLRAAPAPLNPKNGFTVLALVRPASSTPASVTVIFGFGTAADSNPICYGFQYTTGHLGVQFRDNSGSGALVVSSQQMLAGQVYAIAVFGNGTNITGVRINRVSYLDTTSIGAFTAPDNMALGALYRTTAALLWDGDIGDIRAFNRMLVSEEIDEWAGSYGAFDQPRQLWMPPPAGTVYDVDLAETASASDSTDATRTLAAALAESTSATDIVAAAAVFASALSEPASASDTVSSTGSFAHTLSESTSPTDSIAGERVLTGVLAESSSPSDTLTSLIVAAADLSEPASAIDSISTTGVFGAVLTESTSPADTISWGSATYSVDLEESASPADTVSALAMLLETLAEAASSSDAVSALVTFSAAVSEASSALDAISALGVFSLSLSEAATAIDLWSLPGQFIAGNVRVWLVPARQQVVQVDPRSNVWQMR